MLQNALDLITSVQGPWTRPVQAYVGSPVFQRHARTTDFLVSQSQVVMGVSIRGREGEGAGVSANGFGDTSGFVEHVAQIEIGERITWIGFNRLSIMKFRPLIILPVVVERTKIDVRRRMSGLQLQDL